MNGNQNETVVKNKKEPTTDVKKKKEPTTVVKKKKEHRNEFWLVIILLGTFAGLLILLFILPILAADPGKIIEFNKWVIPALLGAFGAWIGAGAAYFFGTESLKESSRSTQLVLDSLKTNVEKYIIEDIHPMAMDPNFRFFPESCVQKVLDGLDENPEYWFVPILKDGKIKDVIHLEAFWRYKGDHTKEVLEKAKVNNVIKYIESELEDKKEKLKEELKEKLKEKLHDFHIIAKLTDKITVTLERMKTENATVGIICDESGKPTHCISRKDLRSFLLNVS